jgi:hypothetical protein
VVWEDGSREAPSYPMCARQRYDSCSFAADILSIFQGVPP